MLQAELPTVSNHKESYPADVPPALDSSSRVACDIGKVMAGSPKTRKEVIENRIWSDDREPELWGTGKAIPINELPTLWREACWYDFAGWWWTTKDGQLFFIMDDYWNSIPVYNLYIYKLSDSNKDFLPLGTIKLKGLVLVNGMNQDTVRSTDEGIQFFPEGVMPIEVKYEEISTQHPKEISLEPKRRKGE